MKCEIAWSEWFDWLACYICDACLCNTRICDGRKLGIILAQASISATPLAK